MKNKLIDILKSAPYGYKSYEEYADYLLANNVIVLPCAPGTPLYNIYVSTDCCYDCPYFNEYDDHDWSDCDKEWPTLTGSVEDYEFGKCCPKHTLKIAEIKFRIGSYDWVRKNLGKTCFLTLEEAEQKKAELEKMRPNQEETEK